MNTIVYKATPTVEKSPVWSFLVSLSLPLLQIIIAIRYFFVGDFDNDLERLALTVIGVFTIGLVSDLVGIIIAMFGIRNRGDEKCTIPLMFNLFFAAPKALILLLIFCF